MRSINLFKLIGVASLLVILCSCSLVKLSGTMTRVTGEAMEDYSKENDGFIAKITGFGGRINTAVGSTVEDIATKKEEGKDVSLGEANKRVISSAVDAAKSEPAKDKETIIKAQKRLQELGFYSEKADGVLGNKTISAIEKYQQKNGLKMTKSLDKNTLASLGINKKQ
jgi:hypothetical protein